MKKEELLRNILREANEFLDGQEHDVPEVEQCLMDLKRAMENAGIVPDDTGEMSTPLPGGGMLVAVADPSDYPGTDIYYEDKEGWRCLIFRAEAGGGEYDPDEIRGYVYADSAKKDYTDKFILSKAGFAGAPYAYKKTIKKRYKIRCYKRNGKIEKEVYAHTFREAESIRMEHGRKIGLKPEPSTDFALYPTIWEYDLETGDYHRIKGY